MNRKTVAQWRREVPAFDRGFRMAAACPVRLVAHLDEGMGAVSFVLHDGGAQMAADDWLRLQGYTPGWVRDDRFEVLVWRKVVQA